jgi:hypothetical protein
VSTAPPAQGGPPVLLRTKPAVLWRLAMLGLIIGAAIAAALRMLEGDSFRMPPPWLLPCLAALSVLGMYFFSAAKADDQGLLLFTSWGFRRRVAWVDVHAVELMRWPWVLWAPALRFTDARGRRLWLIRESQNLAALHQRALRVVGPDHPLVRALQTPLHALR